MKKKQIVYENTACVSGKALDNPELVHLTTSGNEIYEVIVEVQRKSGIFDQVRVRFRDEVVKPEEISRMKGRYLFLFGSVRSVSYHVSGKHHLHLFFWAEKISFGRKEQDDNMFRFTGFIVKKKFRNTPSGIAITDLMVAYNRVNGVSDYIPCIAWGRDAYYAENLVIGDKVDVLGRMQSRIYWKDDNQMKAYEISIQQIEKAG
ncbi:MAG: single-stranded DNA-binding protein [Lachnospiraceae bacterium]|nr:single-stranded DNA-binding protein [Lachnospiraceae bacterium]